MGKLNFLIVLVLIGVVGYGVWQFDLLGKAGNPELSKSFTISKAWWPAWDSLQLGITDAEAGWQNKTKFLQSEDYVPALDHFLQGQADAATLTIYEAILAASQGIPIKIALLLDYTVGSDGVIAKKDIHSILDLKGKRIGVEKGTIAHFTVLKTLEKAGLALSEVSLVDLNLEELKKAFLDNKIDAAGIYEPYMTQLISQGDGHVVFSSKEIPQAICDVLFVRADIVDQNPEVVDHWIKAWDDVLDFRKNSAYLPRLSKLNSTPVTDLKKSLDGIFFTTLKDNHLAFGTQNNPGYLLDSLNEMQDFMIDQGVISQRLVLKNLIYFDGIQRFFNSENKY